MRPLEKGDIIVAEWHTKYGGYRRHTEYTVYLGKNAPDFVVVRPKQAECLIGTPLELAQVG